MLRRTCVSRAGFFKSSATAAAGNGDMWERKQANGRVNAQKLYAFNETLKKDHLKERHYWSENKDLHPINRYQYNKWQERNEKDSIFLHRFNAVPVDQQFRIKKVLSSGNFNLLVPMFAVLLVGFSYIRYKVWGITAVDGQTSIMRNALGNAKPSGFNK